MKKNVEKIQNWKDKNITRVVLEVRNDSHLIDRLATAVKTGRARSRQAYILAAIEAALDRDGIPWNDEMEEETS